MNNETTLKDFSANTLAEFPRYEVLPKQESRLMRTIDTFMRIITLGHNTSFMGYITTMGTTVYVPETWPERTEKQQLITLRHERVHMRQAKLYGRFCFSLLYVFLPLPLLLAWFRTKFEREAYAESIRATAQLIGLSAVKDTAFREKLLGHFSSADYFWAWPWRGSNEKWYDDVVAQVQKKLGR